MSETSDLGSILVWQQHPVRLAFRCYHCNGSGRQDTYHPSDCEHCDGYGWFGMLPWLPTTIHGSRKVPMMQARYHAGLPVQSALDKPEMFERRRSDGTRVD